MPWIRDLFQFLTYTLFKYTHVVYECNSANVWS